MRVGSQALKREGRTGAKKRCGGLSAGQRTAGGHAWVISGRGITRVLLHNDVGFDESLEEGDGVKI